MNKNEIEAIQFDITSGDQTALSMLLSRDGTVNRQGSGALPPEKVAAVAKTDGAAFRKVIELLDERAFQHAAVYDHPDKSGTPVRYRIAFIRSDLRQVVFEFRHGTESRNLGGMLPYFDKLIAVAGSPDQRPLSGGEGKGGKPVNPHRRHRRCSSTPDSSTSSRPSKRSGRRSATSTSGPPGRRLRPLGCSATCTAAAGPCSACTHWAGRSRARVPPARPRPGRCGGCRACDGRLLRLGPRAHVKPHVGWAASVYRMHLGLVVPEGCRLRVAGEARPWREGRCLVFDDTVEHEAWNDSDRPRAVLLLDFLRPGVTGSAADHVPVEVREYAAQLFAKDAVKGR